MTNPRTGVASRCQYLPTIADVHTLLREEEERQRQFRPAHTHYQVLNEQEGPWDKETDYERKARVVRELLGYNPNDVGKPQKRDLVPPSAEDIANLKLKSPPAPPSPHLIALLKKQGWPVVQDKDAAA